MTDPYLGLFIVFLLPTILTWGVAFLYYIFGKPSQRDGIEIVFIIGVVPVVNILMLLILLWGLPEALNLSIEWRRDDD